MASRSAAFAAPLCAALLATATACGSVDLIQPGADKAAPAATHAAKPTASPSGRDNGVASLSAHAIIAKAKATLSHASSLHMAGTGMDSGSRISMDLSLNRAGDCTGTVGLGKGSFEMIKIGRKFWIKPDKAFWMSQTKTRSQGEAVAAMVGDRYLYGTTDDKQFGSMTSACDLGGFISSEDDDSGMTATKGARGEIDGTPVIAVDETDGTDTSTGYVATRGEPYLLRVVSRGKDAGTLDLSEYNKPVKPTPPPADKTLDVKTIEGAGGGATGGTGGSGAGA